MHAHMRHIPFLAVLALRPVPLRGEFRSGFLAGQKLHPAGESGYIHSYGHTDFSVSRPTALVTGEGTDLISGYVKLTFQRLE